MINKIDSIFNNCGITEWGIVKAKVYNEIPEMKDVPFVSANREERINPYLIMENAKSVIVFLIPYKVKNKITNLSDYAKGIDYHIIAKKISDCVCEYLESKGFSGKSFCDNGNLDDRYLAYRAGLGVYGKNRLLINKKYGTYTFIGYIITDCNFDENEPVTGGCLGCGKCIKSCPGGAISEKGIDCNRCASYLTQKKGELTKEEENIIKNSGYVWGCDVCQSVCPMNKNTEYSSIDEFISGTVDELVDEGLSNKEFMNKYKNRAFAWRGAGVIRRNLKISRN